jgi:hypothetical protein
MPCSKQYNLEVGGLSLVPGLVTALDRSRLERFEPSCCWALSFISSVLTFDAVSSDGEFASVCLYLFSILLDS